MLIKERENILLSLSVFSVFVVTGRDTLLYDINTLSMLRTKIRTLELWVLRNNT